MDHYDRLYSIDGWSARIDEGSVSDRDHEWHRLRFVEIKERNRFKDANRFQVELDAGSQLRGHERTAIQCLFILKREANIEVKTNVGV